MAGLALFPTFIFTLAAAVEPSRCTPARPRCGAFWAGVLPRRRERDKIALTFSSITGSETTVLGQDNIVGR